MPISRRASLRIGVYGGAVAAVSGYLFWPRGLDLRDGRHDRRQNGIWLQHGWMGDDVWFSVHDREHQKAELRSEAAVVALSERLDEHGIRDVFPHLCPADPGGGLPGLYDASAKQLLRVLSRKRVMPWIGGVLGESALPDSEAWRARFVESTGALLQRYPALAGVHLNVEPCPSGHLGFLALLEELRGALPSGKLLSVAAYPPPTLLHPFDDVHWSEAYYRDVARHAHQIVPMLYDTSLQFHMLYRGLVEAWTREVLAWSEGCEVLLGVPAYEDRGVGYHDPDVENLETSLTGVHAALASMPSIPPSYRGVAIYSDWEMDDAKWATLATRFGAGPGA